MCKVHMPEIAVNLKQWLAALPRGIFFFHLMGIILHVYPGILMSSVLLFSTLRSWGFLGQSTSHTETLYTFTFSMYAELKVRAIPCFFESMKHPDTFQWESGGALLFQTVWWDISRLFLTQLSRTLPGDTKKLQGNDQITVRLQNPLAANCQASPGWKQGLAELNHWGFLQYSLKEYRGRFCGIQNNSVDTYACMQMSAVTKNI